MKNCTYCGRANSDDASVCGECGTALSPSQSGPQASQHTLPENPARTAREKKMLHGAFWCIGGILVTAITYMAAASGSGGGSYIVAWGAIIFGALQFFRGLPGGDEPPSNEDVGYAALASATKLEAEGRIQEASDLYQKIAEAYPNTGAARDAQKSLEDLRATRG